MAVDFDPTGSLVAGASLDGTVRVWHVGEGTLRAIYRGDGASIGDIFFSSDGAHLIGVSGGDLLVWEVMAATKLPTPDLLAYARSTLPLPRILGQAASALSSNASERVTCSFVHPRSLGLPPQWLSGSLKARQSWKIPESCSAGSGATSANPYVSAQIAEIYGDYEVAIERYKDALQRGNDYALIGLGDLFLLNTSGPEAIQEAMQQYSLARSKHVPLASARLGWLLAKADPAAAHDRFAESAAVGEGDGYAGLGWLEDQSDPIDQTHLRQAFHYYVTAESVYLSKQEVAQATQTAERRSVIARLISPVDYVSKLLRDAEQPGSLQLR